VLSSILWTGLAIGAIYALIAITYNVMFSASRVMSFTAGQVGMLGGIFGALFILRLHLPGGERSARVDEALGLFPEIAAKRHDRGGALSGGQQQMLAVAQGLVRRPRLLMLDEPSAGLSPLLVDRVLSVVARLRETGTSVLLVEQLIEKALAVANRVYALARGRIVLAAPTSDSDLPHRLERAYFGHNVPTTLHR
jgi:branched-chain amino acid transport system ATP-binding protein